MKILQIGELKSNFSKVIQEIKNGEEIIVSFGKKKEKIAVILPYSKYIQKRQRKLGILKNKAKFSINSDFSITDEEFLKL